MPILGKDGKYRPLGYSGDPMDKRQYDEYMKDDATRIKEMRKRKPSPSQDRKYKTKGSNYKPGRAVRKKLSGE